MSSLFAKVLNRDKKKQEIGANELSPQSSHSPRPAASTSNQGTAVSPLKSEKQVKEGTPKSSRKIADHTTHTINQQPSPPKVNATLSPNPQLQTTEPNASNNPGINRPRSLLTTSEREPSLIKAHSKAENSDQVIVKTTNEPTRKPQTNKESASKPPSDQTFLPQIHDSLPLKRSLTVNAAPSRKETTSRSSSFTTAVPTAKSRTSLQEVKDVLSRHGTIVNKFDNSLLKPKTGAFLELPGAQSSSQMFAEPHGDEESDEVSAVAFSANLKQRRPSQLVPIMDKRHSITSVPAWLLEAMNKTNEPTIPSSSQKPLEKWRRYTRYLISIICSDVKMAAKRYSANKEGQNSVLSFTTQTQISDSAHNTKMGQLIALLRIQPENREGNHIHNIEKQLLFFDSFSRYPQTLRQTIAKKARFVHLEPGRTLVQDGRSELYQYFILSGTCEQEELHLDTASFQKQELGPGCFVDEFIPGISIPGKSRKRTRTVRSSTEVQAIFVPVDALLEFNELDASRNKSSRIDLIKSIPGFEFAKETILEAIAMKSLLVSYTPGMTIVSPHDRSYIYFVMSGSCRITRTVPFLSRGMGNPVGYYEPGITVPASGETVIYKKMAIGSLQYGDFFPRPIMNRVDAYKFHAHHKNIAKLHVLANALSSRASPGVKTLLSNQSTTSSAVTFDSIGSSIPKEAEEYMAGADFEITASNYVECLRISRSFLFSVIDIESLIQLTDPLNEGIGGTSLRQIQEAALQKTVWDEFRKEIVNQTRH